MFLKRNGKKLYYEVQGEGKQTLIFVHGWMASSAVWHEQVPYFAGRNRVVTCDLTGYGQSSKPDELAYTQDTWLEDLDALVDHLHLENSVFIGWSMGGAIGVNYAATRPGVLSKLVIVDSTPLLVASSSDFEYGTPPKDAEKFVAAMEQDFNICARSFVNRMFPEPHSKALEDEVYAMTQQTTASVAVKSICSCGTTDLRPMLDKVKIPTLVMHGEKDTVCPLKAGEYLADMIPDAHVHSFPGRGHAPFLTDSNAFNQELDLFIRDSEQEI